MKKIFSFRTTLCNTYRILYLLYYTFYTYAYIQGRAQVKTVHQAKSKISPLLKYKKSMNFFQNFCTPYGINFLRRNRSTSQKMSYLRECRSRLALSSPIPRVGPAYIVHIIKHILQLLIAGLENKRSSSLFSNRSGEIYLSYKFILSVVCSAFSYMRE